MATAASDRRAWDALDVATPAGPLPAGLGMAGFRASGEVVGLQAIPHPAVTIFFDMGDVPLEVEDAEVRRSGSVIVGVVPRPVEGYGRDVECLQVRLSPLLARRAGVPSDLTGTARLADVWGGDAARIEGRLRLATSWDERFAIVRQAIARRAEHGRDERPEVAFAWRQTLAARGRVRIAELASETGWSRQLLWSRFLSATGLTPKLAARLVRFDCAAHRLADGVPAAEVAAEGGYVDQSHLSREVAEFTGATPTVVARAPWLGVDDVAWPASVTAR